MVSEEYDWEGEGRMLREELFEGLGVGEWLSSVNVEVEVDGEVGVGESSIV